MSLTPYPGKHEEATIGGIICDDACKTIAEQHHFPSHYPSPETAMARMVEQLTHPGLYANSSVALIQLHVDSLLCRLQSLSD
jgi:hypothetical protein